MATRVFTIGYGSKDLLDLVRRLRKFGITHVVDVRTNPYSRYQEDFRGAAFRRRLAEEGFRYVFMGDRLGGKPANPEVQTNGHTDYDKLRLAGFFLQGVDRLVEAAKDERKKLCLLCGCSKASECHRGRFLGEVLEDRGVELLHITAHDELETQSVVRDQITQGQAKLF